MARPFRQPRTLFSLVFGPRRSQKALFLRSRSRLNLAQKLLGSRIGRFKLQRFAGFGSGSERPPGGRSSRASTRSASAQGPGWPAPPGLPCGRPPCRLSFHSPPPIPPGLRQSSNRHSQTLDTGARLPAKGRDRDTLWPERRAFERARPVKGRPCARRPLVQHGRGLAEGLLVEAALDALQRIGEAAEELRQRQRLQRGRACTGGPAGFFHASSDWASLSPGRSFRHCASSFRARPCSSADAG